MLNTPRALNGIVTSPHHLASQAGLQILRDGGTAIEAAVACIACLGVLYPHMTGIGGDSFWLISQGDAEPIAIDACGMTGVHVDANLYQRKGLVSIPQRGPLAANTVAGTIAGWEAALKISHGWQPGLPLSRILRDAIGYADGGFPVTRSQAELTTEKLPDLLPITGFAETFLIEGKAPSEGTVMHLGRLARTLRQLADEGLDSFYRGPLSRLVAADLDEAGAPLTRDDLNDYRPLRCAPLQVRVTGAQLFNMPPPTQGVSSLMILALFDRLGVTAPEGFDHIHGIVEATKQAFLVRDREVCDPRFMRLPATEFLRAELLDDLAGRVDPYAALPWPAPPSAGDTVWIGAVDREGRSVSLIQSIFFEFGSGVVLRNTGINWQNRGCSFSLDPNARNTIRARAKPFHTLNPALARFEDGRSMVYGTMGGEGQPQTQAALFSRYAWFNTPLQESITAPRWLLGRTWGDATATLKLENRVAPDVLAALRAAGHDVEIVPAFSSMMGHAGAIVRHPNGVLEGASDPRSDGAVAAW